MGDEQSRCHCACTKDDKSCNFANMVNSPLQQESSLYEKEEQSNLSQSGQDNKMLKNFVQNKIQSPSHFNNENILNVKKSNKNLSPQYRNESLHNLSKFEDKKLDKIRENKVILIQSFFRGYHLRKEWPVMKQVFINETNELIKKNSYIYYGKNVILQRAESLYGSKFDKKEVSSLYTNDSLEKLDPSLKNISKIYEKDVIIYTKILLGPGYDPNMNGVGSDKKEKFVNTNITSFYTGNINKENGKRHEYGILLQSDGTKYEGYWVNGNFTGWGRFIDSDGTILEGCFKEGKLNGKGLKKNLNGNLYRGDFRNNLREGDGREETNEQTYTGKWSNDKKNGEGQLTYKLYKDEYIGQFKDNCITGTGSYKWSNNDEYKGDFLNGKMHGKGIYKWCSGGIYEGNYVHNIKEGKGKFIWSNGRSFEGLFKNGKPNGIGKIYEGDTENEVEFKNGELITKSKDIILKQKKEENNKINAVYKIRNNYINNNLENTIRKSIEDVGEIN